MTKPLTPAQMGAKKPKGQPKKARTRAELEQLKKEGSILGCQGLPKGRPPSQSNAAKVGQKKEKPQEEAPREDDETKKRGNYATYDRQVLAEAVKAKVLKTDPNLDDLDLEELGLSCAEAQAET